MSYAGSLTEACRLVELIPAEKGRVGAFGARFETALYRGQHDRPIATDLAAALIRGSVSRLIASASVSSTTFAVPCSARKCILCNDRKTTLASMPSSFSPRSTTPSAW